MHTIVEIANMLEVTKLEVFNKMEELHEELAPYLKEIDGITYAESQAVGILKNHFRSDVKV